MPQIYINIKALPGVEERARLRGVYRASWSTNVMMFAAARPVLMAFNDQGINYRIIKGAAISALAKNWGRRTMGDIDVVIAEDHLPNALSVLKAHRFFPQMIDGESSDSLKSRAQGPYLSKSRGILDIHSPRGRPDLFGALFREAGQASALIDVPIGIPSSEIMLAISVWHGDSAAAGTDHIQTLLDLGFLIPRVDLRKVRQVVGRSSIINATECYFNELKSFGLMTSGEGIEWSRTSTLEKLASAREGVRLLHRRVSHVASLPRTVRRRRLSKDQRRALRAHSGRGARLYEVWSRMGQLGKLEKFIHAHAGGFGDFGNTGGPIPERDFRMTVPAIPGIPGRLQIHLHFEGASSEVMYRALFIDGKAFGRVPLPSLTSGTYEITPDREFVEVSARSWNSTGTSRIKSAEIGWLGP
jgi:hypothetical protein